MIVGVSKGEFEEAIKLTRNSCLISNGINIKSLPKVGYKNVDINNIKVCTIGRISYQKNPKLFNEVAKNFPEIEFTWIGNGEMIEFLNSPNINVTGWMNKNEALIKMNDADIFLLTSLWEGLPIALLEAMYYKKVCIVSNCIGNRDVIINEKNGFIANNINEFSEIIVNIIENKINIQEIKENAYNDILESYNFDIVAEKYSNLYKSLLNESC